MNTHTHGCGRTFTPSEWLALKSDGVMWLDERSFGEAPYALQLVRCPCGSTLSGLRFEVSRGQFGPMSDHELAAVERCEHEVIQARFSATKQRRAA